MKKLIALVLTALLALNLCACDSGKGASTGSDLTAEQIERLAEKELEKEAKEAEEAQKAAEQN